MRSVLEGGALLPRVGFTPELARAVIETQESKATPKGTLLSEIEQKSTGFFISDVGWDFTNTGFFTQMQFIFKHCAFIANKP